MAAENNFRFLTPNVELLPPSCFTLTNTTPATSAVLPSTNMQTKASPDVGTTHILSSPHEYFDNFSKTKDTKLQDVVSAQAAELVNCHHLETQLHHQLQELQQSLHTYEKSNKKLQEELQVLEQSSAKTLQHFKSEHETETEKIKDQYSKKLSILQVTNEDLNSKLCSQNQQIQELKVQVESWKQYVGENEMSGKSSEIWRTEVSGLKSKIESLQREKANLEKKVEVLNVRLKSQSEIQQLHEQEICQVKDTAWDGKKNVLLTRWREKVFELLIQLKSQDISYEQLKSSTKTQLQELQGESSKSRQEAQVLQHALTDCKAQLEYEASNNQMLQEELCSIQQTAVKLSNDKSSDQAAVQDLTSYVNSFQQACLSISDQWKKFNNQLQSYSQRISFASGRVEMLQGQFARREALLKMSKSETQQSETAAPCEEVDREAVVTLQNELQRVLAERNQLANQIKADANLVERTIQAAKDSSADEINHLKQRLAELHADSEKLQNELQTQQGETLSKEKELEDTRSTLQQVLQTKDSEVLQNQLTERERFQEQLATNDAKLNEAKKEQTKAVVALRQLERQSQRERERWDEEKSTMINEHASQIQALQQQLVTLQQQRNLLQTTLQTTDSQESLQGQSSNPQASSSQADLEMNQDISRGHSNNVPATALLQELKALTEELSDDSDT